MIRLISRCDTVWWLLRWWLLYQGLNMCDCFLLDPRVACGGSRVINLSVSRASCRYWWTSVESCLPHHWTVIYAILSGNFSDFCYLDLFDSWNSDCHNFSCSFVGFFCIGNCSYLGVYLGAISIWGFIGLWGKIAWDLVTIFSF